MSSRSLLSEEDYEELLEEIHGRARSNCLPSVKELLGHEDETLHDTLVEPDAEVGEHKARLHRRLSFADGTSFVVGVIVGSGIFATPGQVLLNAGSVGLTLLAWLAAGVVALFSSFIYAELGSAIPHAGGDSEYLRLAFGYPWSFAFVYSMFFVIKTGGLGIVAITFARYLAPQIFSLSITDPDLDSDVRVKALAVLCITSLTVFNCFGVHAGAWLQNLFSVSKAALITLLISAAVMGVFQDPSIAVDNSRGLFEGSSLTGLGPAMIGALWAFDGWNDIVFLSEELKNPARDVSRCAIYGIFGVVAIYILVNISYLCIIPAAAFKVSQVIALDAASRAFGPWAGTCAALLTAASVLGSCNGSILVGGRYLYATSREGQFFSFLGRVSRKTGAPYPALLTQGGLACLVLLAPAANLASLIQYFGVAVWLFYGLTAAALIKLRHDFPDLPRPYSVRPYPLVPLTIIAVAGYLIVTSFVEQPFPSLLSLAFVLSSVPVYYLFFRVQEPVVTRLS
ncbi:amino acid transporter [Klebsormidium nitens]|uniref:Amino acid transporter n=1 Tax=Klebsormidium nitens TaxID=105231 RepID=A0A0U9HNQ2_KLENI|nr:amino acid transporter [Klebsormidium nitens]|eukprot:GAQ83257.1 amino acid transporter [Klebsormidium nitens]